MHNIWNAHLLKYEYRESRHFIGCAYLLLFADRPTVSKDNTGQANVFTLYINMQYLNTIA